MATAGIVERPPARNRAMTALALAMLLAALAVSIATVALPTLARAFSASMASVQWVVLAYLLTVTIAIVSGGRLGDLAGHRRVFLAGLLIFTLASGLCSLAPTLGTLVAARAVQGLGGAILMALAVSLVRETVPKERIGAAMGLLGTMSATGTALGPSLGGAVIAWLGWRAAFVLLAAVGMAVVVLAVRALPASDPAGRGQGQRLDLPGTLVLGLTLAAYSLAATGAGGALAGYGGLLLVAAGLGAGLFVFVENRTATPLVQLAALRNRAIASSLVMNLLAMTVMMATFVIGAFYLVFGLGLGEASAGLAMAAGPLAAALTGIPAGRVTDRFGAPLMLVIGLVEMTAGLLCLAVLPDMFGVAGYVLSLVLITPGYQLFLAANNVTVMIAAPDDQRGMVSGLLGLSRNLGLMTGASAMGAVFAAAAGTKDIAHASPEAIGSAFTTTFLVAAGLMTVAILTAIAGRRPAGT